MKDISVVNFKPTHDRAVLDSIFIVHCPLQQEPLKRGFLSEGRKRLTSKNDKVKTMVSDVANPLQPNLLNAAVPLGLHF